jgi:hypothetical protein
MQQDKWNAASQESHISIFSGSSKLPQVLHASKQLALQSVDSSEVILVRGSVRRPSSLNMAMHRSLADVISVISSVGHIYDEEHAAAAFLSSITEDGDILDTKHLLFTPELGSKETPAGSSISRAGSILPAVKFENVGSEGLARSSSEE